MESNLLHGLARRVGELSVCCRVLVGPEHWEQLQKNHQVEYTQNNEIQHDNVDERLNYLCKAEAMTEIMIVGVCFVL